MGAEHSATLPGDVFFNGATLQGGTRLVTHPLPLGENPLHAGAGSPCRRGERRRRGGFPPPLHLPPQGLLRGGPPGGKEGGILTQELPVPFLTLRIELPIGGALSLTSVVTGGWLPSVNSLRSEGGVVRISQGHADVSIGMRRRLGAKLRLDATIQGSYFTQHEVSREDDNDPSQDRQGVSSSF